MKNKYKYKIKKKKYIFASIITVLIGITIISLGIGFSEMIEDGMEVALNSELKYYLNISYDGVDKNGIESSDTVVSEISSGTIFVEDRIPDGLDFIGFAPSPNGSIGAVQRNDGSTQCTGKVIDDTNEESNDTGVWNEDQTEYTYHGLHYNAETRKVTFKIKNLKAGCKLTVGIITKTPATVDNPETTEYEEKRRDFYNFATAWEKDLLIKSNTVHAYIGNDYANNYKVTYKYEGEIPLNAPELPDEVIYTENDLVNVAPNIQLEGYIFNGWIADTCDWTEWLDSGKPSSSKTGGDVEPIGTACGSGKAEDIICRASKFPGIPLRDLGQTVVCNPSVGFVCKNQDQKSGGTIPMPYCLNYEIKVQCCGKKLVSTNFIMPNRDVTITGSFTKIDSYKVTYQIEGITPPGYILPLEKEYYPNAIVNLDLLKKGDKINGYRFLGWTTEDVEVSSERDFTMPEKDVVLKGQFEEVTYKVRYEFFDTVLPPNYESYLPETKEYKPGTNVTLEDVKGEPSGYKFLGWYKEDTFEMPNQNVVIYGEWKIQNGTFAPTITKTVVGTKEYYQPGEKVQFRIAIRNTAAFPIRDVIIKENTAKAIIDESSDYTKLSDHVIVIPSIPAGGIAYVYSVYLVTSEEEGTITNEVEIKGALADNHYELEDKEYKATTSFKIKAPIKICKNVDGTYKENNFQFHITGTTNGYDTWISLKAGECKTIYVEPSSYKVLEVVPQEYKIKSVTGSITSNNGTINVILGQKYSITYTNEFVKKNFFHSYGRIVNEINQEGNKVG